MGFLSLIMMGIIVILVAVASYFIGNINGALIIGRAYGIDVRKEGSGNAGTTNVLRSVGRKAGAATFVIDVVKGWAVYFVAAHFLGAEVAMLGGLCVVLGHMWPVVHGFRGGKGVATAFGVLLAANWLFALLLFAVVIVFTAAFRRVSLSVLIAVAVGLVLAFTGDAGLHELAGDVNPLWLAVIFALIVFKHRSNIVRLAKGEESVLTFGKKE
ncbi:MAG: glycerol-3-phosphate acyltransferase [Clostridiales Family XIII bacterium]|jgi:glycerol-3-phosphate acyltransferase PlsY|nr:glycerol-3-phosphate acyltransferase [Clostridiales Family XIII bacterium]